MKVLLAMCLVICVGACTRAPMQKTEGSGAKLVLKNDVQCKGSVQPPEFVRGDLSPAIDGQLLNESLGEPEQGRLCHGAVYTVNDSSDITIYRAWNSTNPQSKMGQWWALYEPSGSVMMYRNDYEICYQWSPLDKMISCRLKAGTQVVIGTGQSARCSEYLNYGVSDKQQVYIPDAQNAVSECKEFLGEFKWKE